jgi:uncharacterized protein YecE (DUF72 family)
MCRVHLDFATAPAPIPIMSVTIHVGTQGWNYDDWLGSFFPDGTRAANFLSMYARAFNSVEVDSTFYAVPLATTLRSWVNRTPDDFIFALKFPKSVTHDDRLRDTVGTTELFFDRVRELGPKLGPVLVQLGPDFQADEYTALADFLPRVPRDLKVAIEFRHRSWLTPSVLTLLRDHGVSVALNDGSWIPRPWLFKLAEQPIGNFTYIRWMGDDRSLTDHSHIQIDRSHELIQWRDRIVALAERVDHIYAYFSNYYAGHAPRNARDLQRLLGLPDVDPAVLGEQISLF